MTPRRYRSSEEDSSRWDALQARPGDIVVSTRSKHGTTWVQTILLMLVHGGTDLPAPLPVLSPWVDHLVEPIEEVVARLDAQQHRRVVKTHTPLDGIPLRTEVTYVVVARHPLDAAVSLYHQGQNIDRDRLHELTGNRSDPAATRPDLATWLTRWIHDDPDPATSLDSLPGVMWHLGDAWRRRHLPNVVMLHYADLLADLDGQMRGLADALGITPGPHWADLVAGATFAQMRRRADLLAPDPAGILKDRRAFFRAGRSGTGAAVLGEEHLDAYRARVADLAPEDLLDWLHR